MTMTVTKADLQTVGTWLLHSDARMFEEEEFVQAIHVLQRFRQQPAAEKAVQRVTHPTNILDDDIWDRFCSYLDSQALVQLSLTCGDMQKVVHRHAQGRTRDFLRERQLQGPLQRLRAQELVTGISWPTTKTPAIVPIPTLLLPGTVEISGAGDDEFNGLYLCTHYSPNGYEFTKPRFENSASRCVLSKQFSHDKLYWYLSKELTRDEERRMERDMVQMEENDSYFRLFVYWAPLLYSNSTGLTAYPSQTSALENGGQSGWQTLPSRNPIPPTVEIFPDATID